MHPKKFGLHSYHFSSFCAICKMISKLIFLSNLSLILVLKLKPVRPKPLDIYNTYTVPMRGAYKKRIYDKCRNALKLFFGEKPDSCGSPGSLASGYQEISPKKKVWIKCAAPVVPSFSLQLKFDENTKHYLTHMLLFINGRYW